MKDDRVYLEHIRDALMATDFGVNLDIVWVAIEKDLPLLRAAVDVLLETTR